jgi:translation initiation factor 2 alpha subunit (eIF-2alpha)
MVAEGSSSEDLLHARIDAMRKERDALEKELERERKCGSGSSQAPANERLLAAQIAEVSADLERLTVDLTQMSSKSAVERHAARVRRVEVTQSQIAASQQVADALSAVGKKEAFAEKQRIVDELKVLLPVLVNDVQRSSADLLEAEAQDHRAESAVLREEQQRLGINIRVLCDKVAQTAQHRLKAQPVKIHTAIEVTCTTEEGIICIRDVLRIGQAQGKVDPPIDIAVSIVAPPAYVLRSLTEQREEGIKKHYDAVKAMEQEMARRGGTVKIVAAPRVIGEEDDGIAAAVPGAEEDSDEDVD